MADLPYVAWLAPFALYLGVTLCRRFPNLYWRLVLIMSALTGNLLLLRGYGWALAALDRLQHDHLSNEAERCLRDHPDACPNPYSLISDLERPPLHWEWVLVGYVLATAGLYFLIYVIEQHLARRESDSAARADRDEAGA